MVARQNDGLFSTKRRCSLGGSNLLDRKHMKWVRPIDLQAFFPTTFVRAMRRRRCGGRLDGVMLAAVPPDQT
jgi:hypothetical protein